MSDSPNSSSNTPWVYAVIALVALVGLLAGLLISKSTAPEPVSVTSTQTAPTDNGPTQAEPGKAPDARDDARRIVRRLSPERRPEVLEKAIANTQGSDRERPRALLEKRKQARLKVLELSQAETLDTDALRAALDEVQKFNGELAAHGNDLAIEVLNQMTFEERKAAATRKRPLTRRERQRERRKKRQDRRERD